MMYSKYQIIKMLKNWFRSMNCFSWIKLILALVHLKYWYYNPPYAELLYRRHHICQILSYPTETPFNTNPIIFCIGFNILSYSIRPRATTSIGYTKSYIKPSQSDLLSSHIQIIISYGWNTLPIKKLSL